MEEQLDEHIMGVIMAEHFPLKKGIALFGDKAEQATTEELQAIHDMGAYGPLDASKLTRDEKHDALESLFFIPGKRDGRMKSSKCAMVNKQRMHDGYDKFAGSSPTVTTKGLILSTAINAYKEWEMSIVDTGTAFLHADNDEEVLMKLRGKIVELLVQLEPTMYRKYVTVGPNGEPILYVRLLKVLYRLLRSTLLFYKKLRGGN